MPESSRKGKQKKGALENLRLQALSYNRMDALALKVQNDVIRLTFRNMKLPEVEPLDISSAILRNDQFRSITILQDKMSEYERTIAELRVEIEARNRFIEELLTKKDIASFNNLAL
jgi:hypothetical protein